MRIHEIKIVPSLLLAVSLLFSAICLASCGETNESADTPIDSMPLFVRAGSVIPTAPDMQHTEQIKQAPYTITVYPGADGRFTLYEDEGDGYDYESGAYAGTDLVWNDAARTLTISDRCGSFDGMTMVRKCRSA